MLVSIPLPARYRMRGGPFPGDVSPSFLGGGALFLVYTILNISFLIGLTNWSVTKAPSAALGAIIEDRMEVSQWFRSHDEIGENGKAVSKASFMPQDILNYQLWARRQLCYFLDIKNTWPEVGCDIQEVHVQTCDSDGTRTDGVCERDQLLSCILEELTWPVSMLTMGLNGKNHSDILKNEAFTTSDEMHQHLGPKRNQCMDTLRDVHRTRLVRAYTLSFIMKFFLLGMGLFWIGLSGGFWTGGLHDYRFAWDVSFWVSIILAISLSELCDLYRLALDTQPLDWLLMPNFVWTLHLRMTFNLILMVCTIGYLHRIF